MSKRLPLIVLVVLICTTMLLSGDASFIPQAAAQNDLDSPLWSDTTGNPVNAWLDDARRVLTPNCGPCHRSTLKTAKPGALAVYDLDLYLWSQPMTDDQLRDLWKRIEDSESFTYAEKLAVDQFVKCELGENCSK